MECQFEGCQEGYILYYYPAEYVTREMAIDAGDLSLEGSLYQTEKYNIVLCPCCNGYFDECENCKTIGDKTYG